MALASASSVTLPPAIGNPPEVEISGHDVSSIYEPPASHLALESASDEPRPLPRKSSSWVPSLKVVRAQISTSASDLRISDWFNFVLFLFRWRVARVCAAILATAETFMISTQQLTPELQAINSRRESNGVRAVSADPGNGMSGLALSGGGIRSAAICLGAVQALQVSDKLKHLDYLSTVSGGGYLGCCLAANMSERGFPFLNETNDLSNLQDSAAVKYIRDHTSYLMPAGISDFLASLGVILRGLAASAILVLGPLLLIAGVTAYAFKLGYVDGSASFAGTLGFACFFLVYLIVLALHRSWLEKNGRAAYEFKSSASGLTVAVMCSLILVFAIELQPVAVLAVRTPIESQGWLTKVIAIAVAVSKYLAPFAGAVAVFGSWLVEVARAAERSPTRASMIKSVLSRSAIWMAAIVMPLLLWRLYLEITSAAIPRGEYYEFALGVLRPWGEYMALAYLLAGAALLLLSWFFLPNANSLHRLYRDRLGDAFLFLAPEGNDENVNPIDAIKLSGLEVSRAPYLLVNTALNIQRSQYANKRGRDADFFVFSRDWIGSHATGYVPTKAIEKRVPTLDLATVMAVSGAAASSNMGASALKPLTFTLALLNIRLGYWMENPSLLRDERIDFKGSDEVGSTIGSHLRSTFYLLSEMFAALDETNDSIYLTDGGHIENLGVYELLRRGCRLVVAIDAEADPDLRFPSLMALQRYARLDLGVRIELPWQKIRERYVECCSQIVDSAASGRALAGTSGCHAAIGRILYPDGEPGTIIYIKSTITGDEDDIILDYKRRYPSFPHETTLDQFFGEEQFEAYRALGFHSVHRLLTGDDAASSSTDLGQTKEARASSINRIFDPSSEG